MKADGRAASVQDFKQSGASCARKTVSHPLLETLTRIVSGARGLIYITVGPLAAEVALGKGGALTGPHGAIAAVGKQPADLLLLWAVLVGTVCYALWAAVGVVFDRLHEGNDLKGLLARFGFLLSAFGDEILIRPTYGYITGASQTATVLK